MLWTLMAKMSDLVKIGTIVIILHKINTPLPLNFRLGLQQIRFCITKFNTLVESEADKLLVVYHRISMCYHLGVTSKKKESI